MLREGANERSRRDLNPQPSGRQPGALSVELLDHGFHRDWDLQRSGTAPRKSSERPVSGGLPSRLWESNPTTAMGDGSSKYVRSEHEGAGPHGVELPCALQGAQQLLVQRSDQYIKEQMCVTIYTRMPHSPSTTSRKRSGIIPVRPSRLGQPSRTAGHAELNRNERWSWKVDVTMEGQAPSAGGLGHRTLARCGEWETAVRQDVTEEG